ncbi:MAG: dockerin type I repeat-containing protein [candidate division Zixibacteria bacterium]|nr:dockerin type I repeat-containing protein [candidate division Zixibacteria bacterium]
MRTIAKLYLMAALLCGLIVTTAAAGDVRDDDRVVDSKVINSQQYAFPAEAGDQALGSSGGSSRGVGLKIGSTWWDQQQIGSMGRMIDYGITPSDPSQMLMHFIWTWAPGYDPTCLSERAYRYEAWDAGAGNLLFSGGINAHPASEYGGYVGIDITGENLALLGGHLKDLSGGDFNSTFFLDYAPGFAYFAYRDSIPNALGTYCSVTPPPPPEDGACWPKFRLVETPTDTFLHVIALEGEPDPGDPAALAYYRLVGTPTSPTATWDFPPYCVDTAYVVGHDIAADDYGKVAITWIAQKHDVTDPCGGGDTCSGLGGANPLVDNDVYYQISYNDGNNWNPRQNITKNYTGDRPYRPYTDLSALIDSKSDFHVAWGSREWVEDAGPPYELTGQIFHWSEDNPFIRTVHPFLWNQQPDCDGGYWMLYASKMTISECNYKLYCLFVQFNNVPNGVIDDCADPSSPGWPTGSANGDLWICVSDDYGLTWDLARNLTNTYTPGCDSVGGEGGPCASENWPSMTKFGTDFYGDFTGVPVIDPSGYYTEDWYLDVQYILDQSAGAYTNGLWPAPGWKSDDRSGPPGLPFQEGKFAEADVEWFRLACVEPEMSPVIVVDPCVYDWPLWVQHGAQLDTTLTIENTGNAILNYTISVEEDNGPGGWLGVGGFSGMLMSGLGNTETGLVIINQGGIVNSPGTEVDLTGRLIINSNAPSSPDTVEVVVTIGDMLDILRLNSSLEEGQSGGVVLQGVLMTDGTTLELWTDATSPKIRTDVFWAHHVKLTDPDYHLGGVPDINHGREVEIEGICTATTLPAVGQMTEDYLIGSVKINSVNFLSAVIPPIPSTPTDNRAVPPSLGKEVPDECKFVILVTGYCDDDFVNDINQKYDYKKNYENVDPDNIVVLGPAACLGDFDAPAGTTDGAGNFTSGGAFPATEDNVQKAFDYIKQQMIASGCAETEFQFHSASHGGGNHTSPNQKFAGTAPDPTGDGWCGGQVDGVGGDEANRISENDLRFNNDGPGTYDTDGDGDGDIEIRGGPPITVYHDADGDGIFEEGELVGTDTNGDGYVDKNDADWTPPDLDGTGTVSMIGVDDIISLGVGGSLVDDELADLISGLVNTPGTGLTKENCRAEMDQCFSGSFIDDLSGCVGEHGTACKAGEYSYGNGKQGAEAHGEYEYPFIEALKTGATWREAHDAAVESVEANEVPETPQFSGSDDCCEGIRGNVDGIGDVNIADLTYLVAYLFTGGPPPPCLEEADVNGDGEINIADLTYLVSYLFTGGPAPVACP